MKRFAIAAIAALITSSAQAAGAIMLNCTGTAEQIPGTKEHVSKGIIVDFAGPHSARGMGWAYAKHQLGERCANRVFRPRRDWIA
jgi:hypothetical protein